MVTDVNSCEKKNEFKNLTRNEIRNILGFWFLGLTNDFAFTVMLAAAHDVLTPEQILKNDYANRTNFLLKDCNPIGTGAILLADTLPEIIIKLTAPLFIYYLSYKFKVAITVFLIQLGIVLVAFGGNDIIALSMIGVALASAGTGVGEAVFLGMSSFYDLNCVSSWCSGTGAAGLAGSLIYAGLTACGVTPQTSIMLMIIGPVFMIGSYALLVTPKEIKHEGILLAGHHTSLDTEEDEDDEKRCVIESPRVDKSSIAQDLTCREKIQIIKSLSNLILWFSLTYFFLYFTNQVLFELIVFENIWLEKTQQYRWYLVICQIGIFIARSSVNIIYTSHTWVFLIIELAMFLILLSIALLQYLHSIFIIFILILIEGMAAGASYVNTFYAVSKKC